MVRWRFLGAIGLGVIIGIILTTQILRLKQHLSPLPSPLPISHLPTATSFSYSQSLPALEGENKVWITRIIDGDTVETSDGRRIRYIGIDTPETVDPRRKVECFGKEAAAKNRELVLGKEVFLEKDVSETDKFDRLLRYVNVPSDGGEVMVNEVLVREGFAFAYTYPPDVKYQERFLAAQRLAQEERRGLWESCPAQGSVASEQSLDQAVVESGIKQSGCVIKGNISSKGEKIYHLPGCGSYDKTVIDESKGERWFCSEEEAVSAGWRKAKNCW